MKVLHLHNIAGVPTTLAQAQRKLGVDARVVVFREHPAKYGYDYNLDVDRYPRILQPSYRLSELLTKFYDFDVYHMHSSSFLTFYADAPILKAMNKIVVYTHWGSDIRFKGIPWYSLSRFCDLRYVGSPDLFQWAPKGTLWLPYPVDVEKWKPSRKKSSSYLTILHAPTNRTVKGTEHVIAAVEELKKEGEKVDLLMVENVSHSIVYDLYKQADIVVDQLNTGFYGTFSCETMSMAKPVCCYVREDLLEYVPDCPIVNVTKQSLKEELRRLVKSERLRTELGKKGREFILKTHDSDKIARNTVCKYKELMA